MLSPYGIDQQHTPVSRTMQYKKVTKPLLERKRRARINRCLDELKELMVTALQSEGENVNKLEKADILELTVQHLHKIHQQRDPVEDAHRFHAGFSHCASEAYQYLVTLPGMDATISSRLVSHLGQCVEGLSQLSPLSVQVPPAQRPYSPPVSPLTPPPATQSHNAETSWKQHRSSHKEVETGSYAMSCTPSAQDLMKPMTGLLMTVRPIPIRPNPQPQTMWRPW